MDNSECKKVIALFSAYIERKLGENDRAFVENHLLNCKSCHDKFLETKEIMKNLRFEYEKLLSEIEREDENRLFRIREYELFRNNISAYIDNELDYEESVKFRKYLLKSKPARTELSAAYGLSAGIKNSFADYKNRLNFNCSKSIIKKLKSENRPGLKFFSLKSAVTVTVLIISFLIVSLYFIFNYLNTAYAALPCDCDSKIADGFSSGFDESEMIEVYFDENGEMLLLYK